jgi:hypothetical protein
MSQQWPLWPGTFRDWRVFQRVSERERLIEFRIISVRCLENYSLRHKSFFKVPYPKGKNSTLLLHLKKRYSYWKFHKLCISVAALINTKKIRGLPYALFFAVFIDTGTETFVRETDSHLAGCFHYKWPKSSQCISLFIYLFYIWRTNSL